MANGFAHVGRLSIFDLVKEVMPEGEFFAQAPAEAVEAYKKNQADGFSTGGGKHEALGFYVLELEPERKPDFVWIEDKLTLIVAHDGVVEWTKD